MKAKAVLFLTISFVFITCLSGCGFISDGPFGWFITNHKTPIAVGTATSDSKIGRACIYSFLGMISIGDSSIEAAMKDGSIETIYTVNKDNLSIFGTYTRQCTIVSGE